MSSSQAFTLDLTQQAREYLSEVVKSPYLRIDIGRGSCSSNSYVLFETDEREEGDVEINVAEGLALLINENVGKKYLNGLKLEIEESSCGQKMLRFANPNAKHVCGCGESFEV